jgi:hypothetical protein
MKQKCNNAPKISVGMRVAQVYFAVMAGVIVPSMANAAISDWFTNIGEEFAKIVPIIVVILGSVGVLMAGFGIISAVMAKKNQRPLEHQPHMIIGGVLCVLLIPFVINMSESVSGESAETTINGFMNN